MMNDFNPQTKIAAAVLATDLDGTLIPLNDSKDNIDDLIRLKNELSNKQISLVYATGRHFESVLEAMQQYSLPKPEWIVCDVGSTIYKRSGDSYKIFNAYEAHLKKSAGSIDRQTIEKLISKIEALTLQPEDHQQQFKISYQCEANMVNQLVEKVDACLKEQALPYECMGSLDPFLNRGLLDVMPRGVSKAYALLWLSTHANFHPDEVVYAGDSGNDYAALVSGFRAIIVANGSPGLVQKVVASLSERKLSDRLYVARGKASTGVLEGCQHFGLFNATG
jgi:sucrose-6F-phosphate phosphohydrolase